MKSTRLGSNALLLVAMLLVGVIYAGWLYFQGQMTGSIQLDGAIGVMLGLYMASHPAGNTLDMLLFWDGDSREKILTSRSGRIWLGLNVLLFLAAWCVIFIGVTRFVRRTG